MKHLRRFNENSHDWRANAFPGMSEEEIEKTLAKAEEEEKVISDKESEEPYESPITDEQREMINMGYPASQVLYGEEDEETTEGSKIKNFFNFKK